MKAIAVYPGKPQSAHLTDIPKPSLENIPNGRGVLVKVLRVGVDGTDKEIYAAEYGAAPKGDDFLVTGHENFGQVEAVGADVTEFKPGDYVIATVRRPGTSIYDRIGLSDMTLDTVYYERGINLLHGFLTEYYVDHADFIVKIPEGIKDIAVLLEPFSIVQKGLAQADEVQRRLCVWQPKRAAVMGARSIGLLATLALRLRGFDVTTFARTPKPNPHSELVEAIGGRYFSTQNESILKGAQDFGPFDLIFEATGYSPIVFESMQALGKNGILVLTSITGGNQTIEIPADEINEQFVLGNKVMVGSVNANRQHFEQGVRDMAQAETEYPNWLNQLLTHKIVGLNNYESLYETLNKANDAIKVYCEVAENTN